MYLVSVLQNCSKRKEESNYKWKSKESTFEMIKVSLLWIEFIDVRIFFI